jgi:hypothetical protein
MDTDGRRSIISNSLFKFISISLSILSLVYINKVFIISNEAINNNLAVDLYKEGYEIVNKTKGVYLVQPVLYERD